MNPANVPASVLQKIATLEHGCLSLSTRLEQARRELQRLRVERRDTQPEAQPDEYAANRESERILSLWASLDADIETQMTRCEALERRLRSSERVVRECKQYLHELGDDVRLVEHVAADRTSADVDVVRARISAVDDEIRRIVSLPTVPSDLGEQVKQYVAHLAKKAAPHVNSGPLRVLWPLHDHADRVTMSAFSPDQCNPLLMCALLQGELLAAHLVKAATEAGISAAERDTRLSALNSELTELRYAEERAIMLSPDDIERRSAPAWAILQVEIEQHPPLQVVAA